MERRDMKQTVEEAASENILFNHRTVDRTLSGKDLAKFGAIVSGYIVVSSGKSPYVATDGGFEFEDWNGYECDMWMYIPSFDEILEANRDVLERIKEKGD